MTDRRFWPRDSAGHPVSFLAPGELEARMEAERARVLAMSPEEREREARALLARLLRGLEMTGTHHRRQDHE